MSEEVTEAVVETTETVETTPTIEELTLALKASEAKAGRILSEKKAAKEQLDSLSATVNQLQAAQKETELSKLSTEDRLSAELQEKDQERQSLAEQLEAQKAELNNFKRTVAIQKHTGDISFKPDIPADVREFAINSAFQSVDLTDDANIAFAKSRFKETYASMIVANAPRGAGSQAVTEESALQGQSLTQEQYLAMSKEDRMKISSEDRAKLSAG